MTFISEWSPPQEAEVTSFTSRNHGKLGRLIGRIYADGKDVNQMMIDFGLARPYNGTGRRGPWWSLYELERG